MATTRAPGKPSNLEQNREEFARYKHDVKERGKPFYPYAMFHDTVMSLVVVGVIVGLASVWFYTSGEDPNTCGGKDSVLFAPPYPGPADPGPPTSSPSPAWNFYFFFYCLR